MNPIPIHAANPGPITGAGNWTYLLRGRVTTLIDAGTGEPQHLDAVERALAGATLAQVIVTHAHTDHAAGAPALAARVPGVRFRKLPWPDRDGKWPVVWEPLADGDVIEAGDTQLTVVHTPGHAPDHIVLWHDETRTVFCGDLAIKGATVWIPQRLQGDLAAYLGSLERVLALQPARMLPAHGPAIDDPEKVLRQYLAHRLEREQQVIDALKRGDRTTVEITSRIYARVGPELRALAEEGVLAHLEKLRGEGRAVVDGDRWQLVDR